MKRQNRINRILNIIVILLILCFLCLLFYSTYNIAIWAIDNKKTQTVIEDIEEVIDVQETNEDVEIINNDEKEDEFNPYWDFINSNLIDVDFKDLKKANSDVKGWIQVNGTSINFPFVQTNDNEYYLTHSFNKKRNLAGWVFLDYRNDISDFNNKNTILYAHGRLDKTMFGSLKNILTSGWLNKKSNYVVKLSTEYEDTLWQVFSVYRIPTTNDYIKTSFVNDEDFENFVNMLLERSAHNFNTSVSGLDRILTLSTCYNSDEKVVLHAKLIKRKIK